MDDNNISEKLQTLARGTNRSATARIREIFDQIETALHAGVLRKDVHQALSESGISLSFASFELAVYRIRKERGKGVMASSKGETNSVSSATSVVDTPARKSEIDLLNKTSIPGFGKAKYKPPTTI